MEVGPVSTPNGAVLLIVDGLSAPFVYPELAPQALDGTFLERALVENIPDPGRDSTRVLEVRAPQTFTEGGHSVLVTGNPKADSELVSFRDATIFDAAHKNGYLCLAVMEKGDSWSICAEQDAILRDRNNSIKKMEISLERYEHLPQNVNVPKGLLKLLEDAAVQAPEYTASKETRHRYAGYNRWGIETACKVVEYMAKNCPDQKYLLTVNVGAVDMSGHYRKNYGYIDCIESLDAVLPPLYELCRDHGIAFILTSDHGMAFPSDDTKGGHQSEKYAVSDEAQLVPFIVHAPGVKNGPLPGEYGQEDIALTLLALLDIPERPRFADGEEIFQKGYVNLKVRLPEKSSVKLQSQEQDFVPPAVDDEFLFLGLKPGSYTLSAFSEDGAGAEKTLEKELSLDGDSVLDFSVVEPVTLENKDTERINGPNSLEMEASSPDGSEGRSQGLFGLSFKHLAGYLLIGLINFVGFVLIVKILKERAF